MLVTFVGGPADGTTEEIEALGWMTGPAPLTAVGDDGMLAVYVWSETKREHDNAFIYNFDRELPPGTYVDGGELPVVVVMHQDD